MTTENRADFLPSYIKASRDIRDILLGMKEGQKLMPEREFCIHLNVSRVTLRRALEPFRKAGNLRVRQGGGTWLEKLPAPVVSHQGGNNNRTVGLLVPSVENSVLARIVRGAEQYISDQDFHLALAHDHGEMDKQIIQLQRMLGRGVAGLMLVPDGENIHREVFISLVKKIHEEGIPLVMIDRYVPELATPSVLSDHFHGMYEATQHMISAGYRKLGLLAFGPETGMADRERRKGFYRALTDSGINPSTCLEASVGLTNYEIPAQKAVEKWIGLSKKRLKFDGIVCMQDNMAYGAYLALKKHGISVPDQVGLVGYDNLNREIYQSVGLHLTSMDQPAEAIGNQSARMLIDRIIGTNPSIKPESILLKPRLIIRSSCGENSSRMLNAVASPV